MRGKRAGAGLNFIRDKNAYQGLIWEMCITSHRQAKKSPAWGRADEPTLGGRGVTLSIAQVAPKV